MPTQAEALAAAERIRQAAAQARQASPTPMDPVLREVAGRLTTVRQHAGWAAFEQAVTAQQVKAEQAYTTLRDALAEGRLVRWEQGPGGVLGRIPVDEAIRLAERRLAELRGITTALAGVLALIPADEEGQG